MTTELNFDNSSVRRQDRLMSKEDALQILNNCEYAVFSMQDTEGGGYGVPVSPVFDDDNHIYIHCALDGHKLNCIKECSKVSLCTVGRTHVDAPRFTTEYESVIVRGNAQVNLSDEEKMQALQLLLNKYCPHDLVNGMKYAYKDLSKTEIIKITISQMSAKCKRTHFLRKV